MCIYKVDNEKLGDAIVFDGVCEFLRKKILVSIVILRAHCHT